MARERVDLPFLLRTAEELAAPKQQATLCTALSQLCWDQQPASSNSSRSEASKGRCSLLAPRLPGLKAQRDQKPWGAGAGGTGGAGPGPRGL